MAHPTRSLAEILKAGAWRSTRHAKILTDEPLSVPPPAWADADLWDELVAAQAAYVARPSRRNLAAFSSLTRELAEQVEAAPRLDPKQAMTLRLGLSPNRAYGHPSGRDDAEIRRRWLAWTAAYGDDFTARRDVPEPPSLERLDDEWEEPPRPERTEKGRHAFTVRQGGKVPHRRGKLRGLVPRGSPEHRQALLAEEAARRDRGVAPRSVEQVYRDAGLVSAGSSSTSSA